MFLIVEFEETYLLNCYCIYLSISFRNSTFRSKLPTTTKQQLQNNNKNKNNNNNHTQFVIDYRFVHPSLSIIGHLQRSRRADSAPKPGAGAYHQLPPAAAATAAPPTATALPAPEACTARSTESHHPITIIDVVVDACCSASTEAAAVPAQPTAPIAAERRAAAPALASAPPPQPPNARLQVRLHTRLQNAEHGLQEQPQDHRARL